MSAAVRSFPARDWRAIGAALAMLCVCAGIVFIGSLIFLFFWIIGGRFTIDGTAQLANLLSHFVGAPFRVAVPLAWHQYMSALPIPVAASAVEFGVPAVLAVFPLPRRVKVVLWIIWAFVSGLDLYTTFMGTGIADRTLHPFRQWLAGNAAGRGVVTGLLTFGPELMATALVTVLSMATRGVITSWRGNDT